MTPSSFHSRLIVAGLGIACLTLVGCSPPPRTVEVIGLVTHNGQPVEKALVVFISTHRDDEPAHAITDANGRYSLETFFGSHDIVRGAVPNRDYKVYIEKYRGIMDNTSVLKKMAAISGQGGDLQRYLREDAMRDLWPEGIPEGWPEGYIPSMGNLRQIMNEDFKAMQEVNQMSRGIPLLPEKYGDPDRSGLTATVERSKKPQVFDFHLTGEVEQIKLRHWDDVSARSDDRSISRSTASVR